MSELLENTGIEGESSLRAAWAGIFEGFVGIHERTGQPYSDIHPEIRHGHKVYKYIPTAHSIDGGKPTLVVIDIFPKDAKDSFRSLVAFAQWKDGKPQIQSLVPESLSDKYMVDKVSMYMGHAAQNFGPEAH